MQPKRVVIDSTTKERESTVAAALLLGGLVFLFGMVGFIGQFARDEPLNWN